MRSMWSSTSSRVIRPPGPVPTRSSGFSPCSATRRRTTGESRRVSPARAAASTAGAAAAGAGAGAGAAGAGAVGAGAGSGAGIGAAGAGSGSGVGIGAAGAGSGAGAGAGSAAAAGAGAAPASPTTAMTAPTGTVSPSCTRISVSVPATGEGTSVSTLSVDTSNSGSSAATASPIFLNQRVIVPSVTVSPSWGRVTSAIVVVPSGVRRVYERAWERGRTDQALRLRPVSDSTVSPNSSVRLGCGWMNSATSATVASQLTAR